MMLKLVEMQGKLVIFGLSNPTIVTEFDLECLLQLAAAEGLKPAAPRRKEASA